MTNSPIVPCIWLDDQAEAAAEFYLAAFRGGNVDAVAHYPESAPNPSGRPPGSVLTVDAYPWSERYAWVMDRFGVSWQVVPEGLLPLLTGPDVVARDRTFAALLGMGKLDLAELRRAYDGG